MSSLTGATARKQYKLAAAAQEQQNQRIADEKSKVDAIEAGQKRVRKGGRGLLAYIDDDLRSTFGGA